MFDYDHLAKQFYEGGHTVEGCTAELEKLGQRLAAITMQIYEFDFNLKRAQETKKDIEEKIRSIQQIKVLLGPWTRGFNS